MQRTLVLALTAAILAAAALAGPAAAETRVARVAIIVGPVGDVTPTYRSLANQAAEAAAANGAEVVKVYSPNATWPAVKRAVEGASIVVYLGHGNGWPSPYRDSLYGATQNGFGLNPVAGRNDRDHQYFGESSVENLHLAPNAVVILSHLCYASGNSEPGLAEGSSDTAVQRVDNYAAGFIRAGASAVVAEAGLGPAYYVKAILRGTGSIENIWAAAPTANGHTFAVASSRSAGFGVQLDPDRTASGFVRSLVSRGITAAQIRAGATGLARSAGPAPVPSLAGRGISFDLPAFRSLPIAGAATTLTLPIAKGRSSRVPAGAEVSVRWDPIVVDEPVPSAPPAPSPEPAPAATPEPAVTLLGPDASAPSGDQSASPASGSVAPAPTATPLPDAPEVNLVVPEQAGSVIEPAKVTRAKAGLRLKVQYPAVPGLYRFSVMLHAPGGVAYDDATQGLLTPVYVTVSGPISAAYGTPAALTLTAGGTAGLPVRVVNNGSQPWDVVTTAPNTRVAGEAHASSRTVTLAASLVATWISASGQPVPEPARAELGDSVSTPGGSSEVLLYLSAPSEAGEYLLLLDITSPAHGALSARGADPAIVRVTVAPDQAVVPQAAPAGAPESAPTSVPAGAETSR